MLARLLFVAVCVLLLVLGTSRRANAADPSARWIMWKPVPPPAPDKLEASGVVATVERFLASVRAASMLRGQSIGRDLSTSLGVRPRGPSIIGASVAGAGAGTWLLTHVGGAKPPINVGPRVYSGGGGIGFSLRW